ncbi:helix-turn-helix domain-containing protein [Miniphocaeibacter halophilus]|uniref:Helix-turn-helix domain-containing protein n=1 Tax=Miniphocaeibacter halophilus TaxID=2931922 RepID=A0AC61MT64_9FIRM|nr:helix-turn-helix transcriptional regulator [Miniphocaeibacter halophilus]QQK08787.1 helix-turn-helix domain-containing protein [Miniphocaeibacter halophilus]
MDCAKIGELIYNLRKEKGLTQKNIADKLNISNKTVSKWERGLGCPDIALWNDLSEMLNIDISQMMTGELSLNKKDIGKISRIRFYTCPNCKNILTSTGEATIFCCGRKLDPLIPKKNEFVNVKIKITDVEYYITTDHEMNRKSYILFAAYVKNDNVFIRRMYPEQSPNFRIPYTPNGKLYIYSTKFGFLNIDNGFN